LISLPLQRIRTPSCPAAISRLEGGDPANDAVLFGETLAIGARCSTCRVWRACTRHGFAAARRLDLTTPPHLMRPFRHARISSVTRDRFSGHGVVIGGVLVDGGQFAWDEPEKARASLH
jgi:O-acetylhomoserine/O-acetylserine sulfhydrylase-like pyridoxal-dependent enzyme